MVLGDLTFTGCHTLKGAVAYLTTHHTLKGVAWQKARPLMSLLRKRESSPSAPGFWPTPE